MKFASPLFDRIRVKPGEDRRVQPDAPCCDWKGCGNTATHRAPKGRLRENEYWRFCLDHVREYNKSYNYFSGMADNDIVAWQRSAATGHRPTWTMGVNREEFDRGSLNPNAAWASAFSDPFGIFGGGGRHTPNAEPVRRPLKNLERRSFVVLDLEGDEGGVEIKARYKALVKQLHPDANGGDRSSEDRLRQIIQAYHYLKAAGFC